MEPPEYPHICTDASGEMPVISCEARTARIPSRAYPFVSRCWGWDGGKGQPHQRVQLEHQKKQRLLGPRGCIAVNKMISEFRISRIEISRIEWQE